MCRYRRARLICRDQRQRYGVGVGGAAAEVWGFSFFLSFLLFFFSYVMQPWSAEILLFLANVRGWETGTLFHFGFGEQGEDPGSTVVLSLAG